MTQIATPITARAAKINLNELAKAINEAKAMEQQQAEAVITEIHQQQPHLLGAIVTLKQLGYEQTQIQVLLNILLVTHRALKHANLNIRQITQQEQKAHLAAYIDFVKNLEEMLPSEKQAAFAQYIDGHKENYLMAYVNNVMYEAGFSAMPAKKGKFLIMAGITIVNSVAAAVDNL